MTESPCGPLPDKEVDRLESKAFKGLLSNRITPELKRLVSDFAIFGRPGIDTIVDHFNERLSEFYSPYRLGAEAEAEAMRIMMMRMEDGRLKPTGSLVEVSADTAPVAETVM